MDKATRPRLYLHGLSLGAYSSAASSSIYDILGDPFDGAFFVGTPFASASWRTAPANRDSGSPWWRPAVGAGSAVRFSKGAGDLATDTRPSGPLRREVIQYPSHHIILFLTTLLRQTPDWFTGHRGGGY